jgi:hypothetical protein
MERRANLRSAFMAHIEGRLDGAPLRLFAYDLSMDGCMVETEDIRLAEGAVVELVLDPATTVSAKVIWRKNRNAGLKFEAKLEPGLVAALVSGNASTHSHDVPMLTREARLKSSRQQRHSHPPM